MIIDEIDFSFSFIFDDDFYVNTQIDEYRVCARAWIQCIKKLQFSSRSKTSLYKKKKKKNRRSQREKEREMGEELLLCSNSTLCGARHRILNLFASRRQGRNRAYSSPSLGPSYILAARVPFSIWLGSGPPSLFTNRFTWSRGNNSRRRSSCPEWEIFGL